MSDSILVVEDERIVAMDLVATLRHLGYEVAGTAANGADALRLTRERQPSLVLMDIHLDGPIDGTQAGAAILSELRTPVVYLTAYAEPDTLRRAEASQPYGYLLKPFDLRELEACLRMALARKRAELATERSEERLRLAMEAGHLGVWEWAPQRGLVHVDGHFEHLLGRQPQPLVERCEALLARAQPEAPPGPASALSNGAVNTVLPLALGDDDAVGWVELHAKACQGRDGRAERVVGVVRDVTERLRVEQQLRQASAVFRTMVEGIAILDGERRIVSVNPAFCTLTGYGEAEVVARPPDDFLFEPGQSPAPDGLHADAGQPFWQGELTMRRADGSRFPAWLHLCQVQDEASQALHHVMTFSDIGQIREAQAHIHRLAFHDALTGLGNRHLLSQRLSDEIRRAARSGMPLALLFIDLDHFKLINDTHGHAVGDELLSAIAQRLSQQLRSSDLAVRLGGDEFVIVVPDLVRLEDAAMVAEKLLSALEQPVLLASCATPLRLGASIGISVYPDNGDSPEALLQAADSAMYGAKESGRRRYAYFSAPMAEMARERLSIEQGLRLALERRELHLVYQPVVALGSGVCTSVEALLRWQHPVWGEVAPARFIGPAEDSGLIVALGRWVLETACRDAAGWLQAGLPPMRLAVNVSVRQMQQPDFAEVVARALRLSGLPPHLLELEITESTLQSPASLDMLGPLRALGVSVAIDDFGTGFSSLSVLRHLAIDRIKIDRSFVNDLPDDFAALQVTRAVIELARAMHLQLTAEGIEHERQRHCLHELGCGEGQGYLFSMPLSAQALQQRLAIARPLA